MTDKIPQKVSREMSLLDRSLTAWIFTAMVAGVLIGYFFSPALFGPSDRWGYYMVGLFLMGIARCIAMCCSSGACGPSVDPVLAHLPEEILENHARRTVVSPWVPQELKNLRLLYTTQEGKAA